MNKVIKINLLFIGLASICSLNSCSNKSLDIRYQEISEEGKTAIELAKSFGWKQDLQYGYRFQELWSVALNRDLDYLDDSLNDELALIKDTPSYNAFLKNEPLIFDNYKTYYMDPSSGNYERVILYLHGGAYFKNILFYQIDSCYEMANKFNARVYIPIYPLVPQCTYKQSYSFLDKLYREMVEREKDKDFVFVGDSAGGGWVLSYSEYLRREKKDMKLPIARVCFSPWCDVTMTNPDINDKIESDIILAPFGLGVIGRYWSADTSTSDYKVSPYYGNLDDKIDTIFFVGSEEIFLSDITKTCRKLHNHGCRTRLVIGNGLFHTYPILSTLPESKEAFDMAFNFIVSNK